MIFVFIFLTLFKFRYDTSPSSLSPLDLRRAIITDVHGSTEASRVSSCVVSGPIGTPAVGGLDLKSYWEILLGNRAAPDSGLFASLSTSARSSPWLSAVATNFDLVRTGKLCDGARGYLTSEVARGACMEYDDMESVLEDLRCLVDVYDAT